MKDISDIKITVNNVKNINYIPEFEVTKRGFWKNTGKRQIEVELFDGSKYIIERNASEDTIKKHLKYSKNLGESIKKLIEEKLLISSIEDINLVKDDITLDIAKDSLKLNRITLEPDSRYFIEYKDKKVKAKVIGCNQKEDYSIMKFMFDNEVVISKIPYSQIYNKTWKDSEYEKKLEKN